MKGWCCALAAALELAACTDTRAPSDRLYTASDGVITTVDGEALFLRGINLREDAKYDPDYLLPLSDAQLGLLQSSGFGAARLLTQWRAVMPAPDEIDADYLGRLAAEARRLAEAGFFLVLDMHQDLWGEPFGDGAPGWACPEEVKAGYQSQSPWWLNYLSDQVGGCFDLFWSDPARQAQWLAAWRAVAAAVCDIEAVVGFDLFNEPFPGSALGDERFDPDTLYPFYRRAMDELDAVCPGRLYFLEPSLASTFGISEPLAIPGADRSRVVLAPHFYPSAVHEPGAGYDGDRVALAVALDALLEPFGSASAWVGEWGGLTDNPNAELYFEHLTGLLQERFLGSALWAFSLGDGGFSLLDAAGRRKAEFARACSLPVPVLVPDKPTAVTVDFEARRLGLEFACRTGRRLWLLMPDGSWAVSFSPDTALELVSQDEHLVELACRQAVEVQAEVAPAE